jgi:3beta-hydroxysteroid-4beta-carboxylate 3-dehydrogenase (decarboxylating)
VLVTGATGHLGANLVRRLLETGEAVRVLLRRSTQTRAVDGLDVEHVPGDLRDPDAARAAVRGCRQVYHCAAKVSTADAQHREIFESNVLGTRHLLRAAREASVSRVVVTGSFSAVGHDRGRPADEETVPVNPFEPLFPYQRSKVAVEHECLKAVVEGLDVVIATSCAIIGPWDFKPSPMGRVLVDFARGKLRAYIPGGFEFVAARDIVEGHLLAMSKGRPGHKYIFSTEFKAVDELMAIYETITGRPRPRLRVSPRLMLAVARVVSPLMARLAPDAPQRFTPGAVRVLRAGRRADITKARTELGYRPTSVEGAIREQYAFFVQQGWIAGEVGR